MADKPKFDELVVEVGEEFEQVFKNRITNELSQFEDLIAKPKTTLFE